MLYTFMNAGLVLYTHRLNVYESFADPSQMLMLQLDFHCYQTGVCVCVCVCVRIVKV